MPTSPGPIPTRSYGCTSPAGREAWGSGAPNRCSRGFHGRVLPTFRAALRGERLWSVNSSTGAASAFFVNTYGRLRDVVSGPDGTLWFVTNNTDGRGTRAAGDDRLYPVRVAQVAPALDIRAVPEGTVTL